MGGGGSQRTEQEPWDAQQPYLRDVFSRGQDTYNRSINNGNWTGDFFAPEDQRTGAARDAWYEFNRQNTGYMNPAVNYTQSFFSPESYGENQNYLNAAVNTNRNYHGAQDFTQRMQNTNLLDYVSPFSNERMAGPSGAWANVLGGQNPGGVLGQTLSGDFMDPNNPLIQNYLNAATRPVQENLIRNQLPQMDSAAIANGAYGGNANAVQRGQAIGDTNQAIADTRANYLYNNQQAERERQQQTAMAERGYQVGAAGQERGFEAQNYQQRQNLLEQDRNMQANNLMQQFSQNSQNAFQNAGMEANRNAMLAGLGTQGFNRGMQASSMMPGFFQAAQQPYQNMSSLGDAFTQSNQRVLDNSRMMWDQPSQFAWNQLNNYQNTVNGNYGMTGNSSGGGSAAMGMLGGGMLGGMGGSALASAGFMAPMMAANPWLSFGLPIGGALLGGGLGGMFS